MHPRTGITMERGGTDSRRGAEYAEEGVIDSYRAEDWYNRKHWLAHSRILSLARRIKIDLKEAKAKRYDAIAQHYDQLCILDSEGNLPLPKIERLL